MKLEGFDMDNLKLSIHILSILLIASIAMSFCNPVFSMNSEKPRIIATTDGEIDDRCSMVRLLLYANEWDIEGIVISSSRFHWKGHDWAGVKWIDEDIDLYAQSYENLIQHAPDLPTPDDLKKLIYVGNIDDEGEMGKDTPGSPLTDQVVFPRKGTVWDFNYRGELLFLQQAFGQEPELNLTVEDGWTYFVHGWTRAISEVFQIDIPTEGSIFEELSRIAARLRD